MAHISDEELERYCLGTITEEFELAPMEEHILACPDCAVRAERTQAYVDAVRAAASKGGHDLSHE
jgi:anti-sigma factor RsiW